MAKQKKDIVYRFKQIFNERFKTRDWFTYSDVMADYLKADNRDNESVEKNGISNCKHVKALEKAFREMRKDIGEDSFEVKGNNRNRSFRYVGKKTDPLAELERYKIVSSISKYRDFCISSAAFYPMAWFEYFFKDCRDFWVWESRKCKGEQVMETSMDRVSTNIEYLPMLYEAVVKKHVLEIEYKPYEKDVEKLIFHPNYLKEYNGRWNLFGHAEEHTPEFCYHVALDRIVSCPQRVQDKDYKAAPPKFYVNYFKNIVGLSCPKESSIYTVVVRTHTFYMYKLTETKPIHITQKISKPWGEYEGGSYGEFSIRVKINNEFFGRILQMGSGLEIVSPYRVRQMFKRNVEDLAKLYRQ